MSAKIWAYGPHSAFPEFDFGLPPDHTNNARRDDEKPLSDPTYSPMYGIDLLSKLKDHGCDIHISQYIGTKDLFYHQNLRMEEYLAECGIRHTLRIVRFSQVVYVVSLIPFSTPVWVISWAHPFFLNATTCLPTSKVGLVGAQKRLISKAAHRGPPLGDEMVEVYRSIRFYFSCRRRRERDD
jgi:hypothetical protein